jgi:hypothetical protein
VNVYRKLASSATPGCFLGAVRISNPRGIPRIAKKQATSFADSHKW